jgi:hypothetical protein
MDTSLASLRYCRRDVDLLNSENEVGDHVCGNLRGNRLILGRIGPASCSSELGPKANLGSVIHFLETDNVHIRLLRLKTGGKRTRLFPVLDGVGPR